ncbi:hypothetical protein VUR80DRAFT_2740 [Thermomyces stellatus]
MTVPKFAPVRACLFDMDGLLLDTEDIATHCHTLVLAKYGRPALPPSIKAKMMGRNGTAATQILQDWAQLPITNAEYRKEVVEHQKGLFSNAAPLPGVEILLKDLASTKVWEKHSKAEGGPQRVHIALATSSSSETFKVKTARLQGLFDLFEPERVVLGDDPRLASGRGKPMPDIYQLALKSINDSLSPGEEPITPAECLVFEDSVTGVEAGRRAGMRVVWCPLPTLAKEYAGMEAEVLAGRTNSAGEGVDEHQLGEIGDGWAEQVASLVDFPYEKYGIVIPQEDEDEKQINGVKVNGVQANGANVSGTDANERKKNNADANGPKEHKAKVNGASEDVVEVSGT